MKKLLLLLLIPLIIWSQSDVISRIRVLKREIRNDDWTTKGDWWFKGLTTIDSLNAVLAVRLFTADSGIFFPNNRKAMFGNTATNPDLTIYRETTEWDKPVIIWTDQTNTVGLQLGLQEYPAIPINDWWPKITPIGSDVGSEGITWFVNKFDIRHDGSVQLNFWGNLDVYPNATAFHYWNGAFFGITVGEGDLQFTAYAPTSGDSKDIIFKTGFLVSTERLRIKDNDPSATFSVDAFWGDNKGIRFGNIFATPDGKIYSNGINLKIEGLDTLQVGHLEIDNTTTYIDKDGSNNMTFTDAITGTKTLAQLTNLKLYQESFTNGDLVAGVLTVTHGLDNQYNVIQVYDNSKMQITPDSIECTSATTSKVYLSSYGTISGTWWALFNGGQIKTKDRIKLIASDFGTPHQYSNLYGDATGDQWRVLYSPYDAVGYVHIPDGYKATFVMVYGNQNRAITVYECEIDDGTTAINRGSGNMNTQIDITDVSYTTTNYLTIYVNMTTSSDYIWGGYVMISPI